MTTPERLRSRQRTETRLVVATIILVFGSWAWSNHQDAKQQECVADNFSRLSAVLQARGALSQEESDATRRVLETAATATSGEPVAKALDEYLATQNDIKERRDHSPIPAFPTGKCDA